MKSKIFKIVLPAFALMLAISASLAFTSVENSMEEDAIETSGWYQNVVPPTQASHCTFVPIINCDTVDQNAGLCSVIVTIGGVPTLKQVYKKATPLALCNTTLYKRP